MITTLEKITALVLIDLQKGILASLPPAVLTPLLDAACRLADAFRNAGLPVVLVNVDPAGSRSGATRKDAKTPVRMLTGEALELIPAIGPVPDDILITKHTWGAFFETGLDAELRRRGVTGIVLGGVSTSIGVEGTARQASELGYHIVFARDAMRDGVPDSGEKSLQYIFPRLGEVDDTDAIISKLS